MCARAHVCAHARMCTTTYRVLSACRPRAHTHTHTRAGLVPGVDLRHQRLVDMYKMRNLLAPHADAEGAAAAAPGAAGQPHLPWAALDHTRAGQPWAGLWEGPPHVFFGHDAKRGLQLERHATGLDTGAVYGGALTACVLPPLAQRRGPSPPASASGGGGASSSFSTKLAVGQALTREDLRAQIVQVPATAVHSKPGGGRDGAAAAAAVATSLPAAAVGTGAPASPPLQPRP
jgi:hypothetical protein